MVLHRGRCGRVGRRRTTTQKRPTTPVGLFYTPKINTTAHHPSQWERTQPTTGAHLCRSPNHTASGRPSTHGTPRRLSIDARPRRPSTHATRGRSSNGPRRADHPMGPRARSQRGHAIQRGHAGPITQWGRGHDHSAATPSNGATRARSQRGHAGTIKSRPGTAAVQGRVTGRRHGARAGRARHAERRRGIASRGLVANADRGGARLAGCCPHGPKGRREGLRREY
jgi:hypothetical protein